MDDNGVVAYFREKRERRRENGAKLQRWRTRDLEALAAQYGVEFELRDAGLVARCRFAGASGYLDWWLTTGTVVIHRGALAHALHAQRFEDMVRLLNTVGAP